MTWNLFSCNFLFKIKQKACSGPCWVGYVLQSILESPVLIIPSICDCHYPTCNLGCIISQKYQNLKPPTDSKGRETLLEIKDSKKHTLLCIKVAFAVCARWVCYSFFVLLSSCCLLLLLKWEEAVHKSNILSFVGFWLIDTPPFFIRFFWHCIKHLVSWRGEGVVSIYRCRPTDQYEITCKRG